MNITRCKTNHLIDPIGFDMSHVVLTWSVEKSQSRKQLYARILLATDEEFNSIVLDSGYCSETDNRGYEIDIQLTSCTRYFWKVDVIGDCDRATSRVNFFETGKLTDPWLGHWIIPPWEDTSIGPYLRKSFCIEKPLMKARAYIIGLGLYEFEINGTKVGNERLTPYCNAYDAWLQYQTYDITNILMKGENVAGVLLGNGWAKGRFGAFGAANSPYIDHFTLLCEIHLTYLDGSSAVIYSDESWLCHPSPVLMDSIYDGEIYDANMALSGWSQVGLNESSWQQVMLCSKPDNLGWVVERLSPSVIVKKTRIPQKLFTTPAGETVLDMGQNMVGWLRFRVNEPRGTKVTITYGEVLQEGNFYRDNLREAKAQHIYISDGNRTVVEPHFTFFGFRYVKLEGFTTPLSECDFIGCVIYSDLESTGQINTSDSRINRLFQNALWSQKGNFLDIPTDCPQRDERMGWTGDAQVFCGTATYNMDTYAFYTKFLWDLHEEQKYSLGMVANTVPTFLQDKKTESSFMAGGACGWGDAATIIPWHLYLQYGDKSILERQYISMKSWVDWIIDKDNKDGQKYLWLKGFQFGDWLALDGPVTGGVVGGTDNGFIASAYYRLSSLILSKAAAVLGKLSDAEYYSQRSELVKKSIQNEYFTQSGQCVVKTQTAYVVALHFDLVENSQKARVLSDLKTLLQKNDMHLSTGFLGTPYLCKALSDNGAINEAYQLLFQDDFPSWLYEVKLGATTIWERWNSILPDGSISGTGMNSLNHYAYGSIVEWLYRHMCGLKPHENEPGFKKFTLCPEINGKLNCAEMTYLSPMGEIYSRWEILDKQSVKLEVRIPFNTEATIIPLNAVPDSVIILGKNAKNTYPDSKGTIELGSGDYTLYWESSFSLLPTFSLSTPLWELKKYPETKSILRKYFPHFVNQTKEQFGREFPYSIQAALDEQEPLFKRRMLQGANISAFVEELQSVLYPDK